MDNTGYIALSSQMALWRRLEAIGNNVANVNTPGYRGSDLLFTDYLTRSASDDSAFKEKLNFVQDYGQLIDFRPGEIKSTGNSMDIAIETEGFFAVDTPAGEAYTRAGHFTLNADGTVVTPEGHALLTQNGTPLIVAPNEGKFEVARDGSVSTENGPLGRLKIVTFDEPEKLNKMSGSLFQTAEGQEAKPAEKVRVAQGMLEGSNVNSVLEITKLIDVQRSYGSAQNLIDAENDRVRRAIQMWSSRSA